MLTYTTSRGEVSPGDERARDGSVSMDRAQEVSMRVTVSQGRWSRKHLWAGQDDSYKRNKATQPIQPQGSGGREPDYTF